MKQLTQYSSKPILYRAIGALALAVILLIYLFVSVPRHNQLTRSLGELRLLSQMISRQATEATESVFTNTKSNMH